MLPDYIARALRENPTARAAFDAFPPSHQGEYVRWVTEAKKESTRHRRLQQMMLMLVEGRPSGPGGFPGGSGGKPARKQSAGPSASKKRARRSAPAKPKRGT